MELISDIQIKSLFLGNIFFLMQLFFRFEG